MIPLSILVACNGNLPTEEEVPWIPPGDVGGYDVGVTTISFVDDRGKDLTMEVWYPAKPSADDLPDPYIEIPLTMDAYRNAPAAGGPFPLVAFTHGHFGIRYQSAFLCEHLASHGLVVVAPDHPGDTFLDMREDDLWQIVLERPGDVISSVDALLDLSASGDPLLGGITAATSYAIVGHSLGSLTSLVIGGGEPDLDAFADFCGQPENASYDGCDRIDDIDLTGVEAHAADDPRAVVTIPMSPGLWYAFGDTGLRAVRAPLVVAGQLDDVLPYDTEARPVFDGLATPAEMAIFPDAGHYAWTDICLMLPIWEECGGEDEGFIDIASAQAITEGMVTAWIRGKLLGDADAEDWLTTSLPDWPEVQWEQK